MESILHSQMQTLTSILWKRDIPLLQSFQEHFGAHPHELALLSPRTLIYDQENDKIYFPVQEKKVVRTMADLNPSQSKEFGGEYEGLRKLPKSDRVNQLQDDLKKATKEIQIREAFHRYIIRILTFYTEYETEGAEIKSTSIHSIEKAKRKCFDKTGFLGRVSSSDFFPSWIEKETHTWATFLSNNFFSDSKYSFFKISYFQDSMRKRVNNKKRVKLNPLKRFGLLWKVQELNFLTTQIPILTKSIPFKPRAPITNLEPLYKEQIMEHQLFPFKELDTENTLRYQYTHFPALLPSLLDLCISKAEPTLSLLPEVLSLCPEDQR